MSITSALPLKKISIFSSGLAYYEHSGELAAPAVIKLSFRAEALNDALKSLVLNDPSSSNPSVTYQSPQTLLQTLKSLKIDLSNNPDMAGILGGLRGAEVIVSVPAAIHGKIAGVEYRSRTVPPSGGVITEPWISLYTEEGIRMFSLGEISSICFTDDEISGDLKRALDLVAASRNSGLLDLACKLPGEGSRMVFLSYVIPSPVWKASYRLDLGRGEGKAALFQGWAIIDNDSDCDWNAVEISLVAGRPVSFIQNLYPPYYLPRPTLPLAIAGAAAAETHDSGYAAPVQQQGYAATMKERSAAKQMRVLNTEISEDACYGDYDVETISGGAMAAAGGAAAGDQYAFTLKDPVNLDRRMSAMLPLVESAIESRKLLLFSGNIPDMQNRNPRLGAELVNITGMKLPAGPITVYDGGTYAGDALIEFWNEGEKRLISFGEDLSVTGMASSARNSTLVAFTIGGGMLIFSQKQNFTRTYTFKNNAAQSKQLIIEHPKTRDAILESPAAEEQTPAAYRFAAVLSGGEEIKIIVRESCPDMQHVSLLEQKEDSFLSYVRREDIPGEIKAALQRGGKLRAAMSVAEAAVERAAGKTKSLVKDQERIRKNLEAAGSQSPQGQEYLKKMAALDKSIEASEKEIEKLEELSEKARMAFKDYINALSMQIAV